MRAAWPAVVFGPLLDPEAAAVTPQVSVGAGIAFGLGRAKDVAVVLTGDASVVTADGAYSWDVPEQDPSPMVGLFTRFGVARRRGLLADVGMHGGMAWAWSGMDAHAVAFGTELEGGMRFSDRGRSIVAGGRLILDPHDYYLGCLSGNFPSGCSAVTARPQAVVRGDALLEPGRVESELGLEYALPQLPLLEAIPYVGRPVRVAGGIAEPTVGTARKPDAAAARWLEEGRAELASVSSFLRLARELADLGAPSALRVRCELAARDEVAHAAICFGMAARRTGPVSAVPVPVVPRRFSSRDEALAVLAAESLVDGAIGEAQAARRAEAQSLASRGAVARLRARIASDERRHASLGRDVARWCVAQGH